MYGVDIGTLEVAFSTDSIEWNTVWRQEGEQGENWNFALVEIPNTFHRGLIRFSATRSQTGLRGDIAIDNIKLIGIDTIQPIVAYVDDDLDGFGVDGLQVLLCSSDLLEGYSLVGGDCDDNDPQVNPAAMESACNNIDENCNGVTDDVGAVSIGYITGAISAETCLGAGNGFITIQAINGQMPYTYDWSNGESGQGITDLSSGVYFCTITDRGGCKAVTDAIFLDYEDLIVYSIKDITASPCVGSRDATVELRIEGGVPPYQINWSNGRRGSFVTNLDDGVYYATITDASSCATVIDSVVIASPQALTTGVVLQRNNDCKDGSSGFIQLGIVGGNPPYSIEWDTGEESNILNSLAAGFYSVTIEDQVGCKSILSNIEILEPEALSAEVIALENITCSGGSDSFVDLRVSGGTAPYSYFWSDGSNSQDLIRKPAGNYSVTISDIQSCSFVMHDIVIAEPNPLTLSVDSLSNVNCAGSSSGYVEISVEGGTGPYAYNWGIFDGEQLSDNYLDTLGPGAYSLTVVDNFECKSKAFSVEVLSLDVPLNLL